jgi:phosphatidylserine/phosphatidylglycerophosphate/cardiolipin synthase-like enzyme
VTANPLAVDLSSLDGFKAQPFTPGYPENCRTFYSPVDDVHGALAAVLESAQETLLIGMYGFDDDALAEIVKDKLADPNCYVQISLDSSQAGGTHERALLTQMDYPASSVAVGTSERGKIMHLKEVVIDGAVVITGSTNWSLCAEVEQDNALTIISDPFVAAEAAARLNAIHAHMLIQHGSRGHRIAAMLGAVFHPRGKHVLL